RSPRNRDMRLKTFVSLILSSVLLVLPLRAQEPVDAAINAKIRDEGLNRSQVLKTFTHFTEVIGPRLTGSPAVKAADDYALGLLKDWGVGDPHLEAWDFGRGWTLERSTVALVEPRYMRLLGY